MAINGVQGRSFSTVGGGGGGGGGGERGFNAVRPRGG